MSIFVPHTRGKRKQGRSQSLPARIDPVFREITEEGLRNETHPQARSLDEWTHLELDEHGAELAREARVWKVYVEESDKWDKELVEGWDKSMDVLLVFAALFSAISSAFLIESSSALKEDPADVSAEALRAISRTLVTIANGNFSAGSPTPLELEQDNASDFVPSHNAVIVNTLWYLSLSLSIATAFLAMLAKDWCYSFTAHRSGHPRDQAHRRQRKWKLIERWKMQELIVMLPSLMHMSLLLFTIGLCVYLWDLNHTAAIPVICIGGAFLLFYIWSSVIASLVEDFPYTTIISWVMRSQYMSIIYPTITKIGYFFALLPIYLAMGVFIVYTGIIWVLSRVIILAIALLMLPLCPIYCFLGGDADIDQLYCPARDNISAFAETFIGLPIRGLLSLGSYLSHAIERLELTEDLTTSLALSWIIQHCETPSAVDIALQAIAGASSSIPKEPLLLSHASAQIMRRIVSHGASDIERAKNLLYTRSLEFLGLNSTLGSAIEVRRVTGDIEVMVWDLKSKNERDIAFLIQDGSFVPNEVNLEAMRTGNSATTQWLRVWRQKMMDNSGDASRHSQKATGVNIGNEHEHDICTWSADQAHHSENHILHSVTRLLSHHLNSQEQALHPAAVQSIAHAAALHASLLATPDQPVDLVRLCMEYCEQLVCGQATDETFALPPNLGAGVVFIVCVLLLGCPSEAIHPGTTRPVSQLRTRALHAIQMLIDVSVGDTRLRENIFWIGCSEILSNRSKYGLNRYSKNWVSLEHWCSYRASKFIGGSGTPFTPSWSLDNHMIKVARNNFLTAISKVYKLVTASQPPGSVPIYPLGSIHTILAIVACSNTLDSWQRQTSSALLSEFGFPKPSKEFIDSLEMPTSVADETALSAIGATYSRKLKSQARQYFAGGQLWLVLDSIDELSLDDQQRMKTCIENQLEGSLNLQAKGFDQAKRDLEAFIIEGYRKEHRINDHVIQVSMTDNVTPSPYIWNTVKTWLKESWKGGDSQRTFLPLRVESNRLENNFQANNEDLHSQANQQRLYMARIIERILQKRGLEENEDLIPFIVADFKELLPCYQKLLPTLAPLPPSRGISHELLPPAQSEATLPPHTTLGPLISDSGDVILVVYDSRDTSSADGHNLS